MMVGSLLFSSCSEQRPSATETDHLTETETILSSESETEAEVEKQEDPSKDNELNLLFIGNSYCYYWTDELYGMLTAAGYEKVTVCNVYYSGCTLEQHWNWLRIDKAAYDFHVINTAGKKVTKEITLKNCLQYKNWDVISLQSGGRSIYRSEEEYRSQNRTYFPPLYNYIFGRFPLTNFFWQQSWVREIGSEQVKTTEEQRNFTDIARRFAHELCEKYGLTNVPLGDAWEMVRHDPLIQKGGKNLTTRIYKGVGDYDDLSHDGDVGGGQYLNACVWYEMLTGKSCLENSFRPKYEFEGADLSLSEEKIALLQNAAHEAVAAAKQK